MQDFKVGQHLDVQLELELGALQVEDLVVELVVTRGEGDEETTVVPMVHKSVSTGGAHTFQGDYRIELAGHYSHGMRVRVPSHGRHDAKVRGLVLWA